MSAAAIERDLATNRRKQAEAQASAAAHHGDAKASVDNPARFARASGRAANEERRLAIYHEEEARLLEALPAAKRQDEIEAHRRAVVAYEKDKRALADEWKREYPKLAAPIVALCKRLDESDGVGVALRAAAKRLGVGASDLSGTAEDLARPSTSEERLEGRGLRESWEHGQPITERDFESTVKVKRFVRRGPIRDLIDLPDFGDSGRPLWGGRGLMPKP